MEVIKADGSCPVKDCVLTVAVPFPFSSPN